MSITKLRHFIVGDRGNMGGRRKAILEGFGDIVDGVDIGWDPSGEDFRPYDSVLVCTPPKTHLEIISQLPNMPVFCEKPIFQGIDLDVKFPIFDISMVGCNWRWCNHIVPLGEIVCNYKSNCRDASYDLIHFLDLFWQTYGKPEAIIRHYYDKVQLECQYGPALYLRSAIQYTKDKPETWHRGYGSGGAQIHIEPCNSINLETQYWRDCVLTKKQSYNPIEMAIDRTKYLVELQQRAIVEMQSVP